MFVVGHSIKLEESSNGGLYWKQFPIQHTTDNIQ